MNKTFHGAKVEISPSKSWTNLYNRCVDITTTTTTTNATKLRHLHPYKTTMINKTYTTDTEVELNFENWYPQLWVGRGGGILQKLTQPSYFFIMELGSTPLH